MGRLSEVLAEASNTLSEHLLYMTTLRLKKIEDVSGVVQSTPIMKYILAVSFCRSNKLIYLLVLRHIHSVSTVPSAVYLITAEITVPEGTGGTAFAVVATVVMCQWDSTDSVKVSGHSAYHCQRLEEVT